MRREDGPRVLQQPRGDAAGTVWQVPVLHLEDISRVGAQTPGFQSRENRLLVDHRAPSDVHQQLPRAGVGQRPLVDEMARRRCERHRQQHVVRLLHGLSKACRAGACIALRRIHTQDLRAAETLEPIDDGAPDRAETDHGHRRSVQACAVERRAPARVAGTHAPIAVEQMPARGDGQADGQLRGRLGQQVRHEAHLHTRAGTGGQVEVVVALERTRHRAQARCARKHRRVDAVGHEGHPGVGRTQVAGQPFGVPGLGPGIHHHLAGRLQSREDFGVDGLADDDAAHAAAPLHFRRLRNAAPRPSTTSTQASTDSRMAETSSYLISRSAAISSKPMPPAPTMPSTAEARKWYSQR